MIELIRKLTFPLLLALSLGLATLQAQDIELIPSGPVTYDQNTGELVATDGAQITYGDWLLSAETIRFNQESGNATATGKVVFSRYDLRLTADNLTYRPSDQFARAENFRAGNGLYYVEGNLLEGNPDNFRFEGVNFHPGEPGTFLFVAKAGELALIDQNEVRGKRLFFKVGAVPFLLIPNITQPLDAETNLFKPTIDYSGHIGALIGAEALAPVNEHIRLGGNVALTTERGFLVGPAARYSFDEENYTVRGAFISGYIDDDGEPGRGVDGELIDSDRYFAEWKHRQMWTDNRANINAYARYWSDSEVTRDFYEESFDRMQDPDSYLEANYNADNWQLSFFTRAALGEFQTYVERLPELRFTYFPTELGHGFSHSGFFSAARLQQNTVSNQSVSSNKLDAHYGIEWNKSLSDGINLRLKAGARGLRYDDAESYIQYSFGGNPAPSPDQQTFSGNRAYGELGADLNLKAYATYDFQNESWNISGIRHIFEPRLSYRYVPELTFDDSLNGRQLFYQPNTPINARGVDSLYIEQGAFANYLPSLDLENRRDADNIREDHKLRLELRNRIQTRHKDGGSRDLARFDLATDYYLKGSEYAEKYYSLLNLDFELTPAPWLELTAFTRLDPEDGFSFQEFNSSIAIKDEGYWKIAFGSHYLDGDSSFNNSFYQFQSPFYSWQTWPNYGRSWPEYRNLRLEQYFAHLEYQFSENLKLYATTRYDDESGVFYEQRIGIMQRALEQFGLQYELRIYDGDRRESDFGVSIGIDLFDE
ncbi:putative LPS assembly protein LptD [Pelagicoccus mobilis]|uniref:LPS-assembly protein LptD n=1 Tax=Pelagicoccus mobilis TaxID=415221 RepID=A0A934RZK5_9BACT|nr:putative LPS assembly protein LptD [Pelagicoccus mobilis]MBK1879536.1 LPS-assembly protein LptD [Pelagicoccus mobilis]